MKDRIREIIEYLEISQAEFALAIGVQRANVTHFVTGRNKPGLDIVQRILVKYPMLNAEWLILGNGEMLKENSKNTKSKQPNLFTNNIQETNNVNVNKELDSNLSSKNVNIESSNNSKQNNNNEELEKQEIVNQQNDFIENQKLVNKSDSNSNHSQQTTVTNNNSQSVNIISSSPDHIVVLFDDQTFITYRKRN